MNHGLLAGRCEKVALSEVCEFILDGTHGSPVRTEAGVPVLSANNVADGELNFVTDRYTSEAEYQVFKRRLNPEVGDVLLTIVGTIGRVAIIRNASPAVFQRSVAVLRPRAKMIDGRYLFHSLRAADAQRQFSALTNKSAQAGVYLGKLKTVEILLPSIDHQKRVAAVLDKAEEIQRKRKEAITLLDLRAEDFFIASFGDPALNPQQWPMVSVGDIVDEIRDGPHVSPEYSDTGIPILSTRNIRKGALVLKDLKYLSQTTYAELTKRFKPRLGDVLLTKGGTTGLAKLVDWNWPFAVWVHTAVLRPKKGISPRFLEAALNTTYCYQQSQKYTHGIANRDLGLTRIAKITLPLPSLAAQERFDRVHASISSVAQKLNSAVDEASSLAESLRFRAFSCEL
jgi:type I restriction enzyme S subunit